MRQMRLVRHFAATRRLLVVSVMVLAPAIGLATGCSSVRKAIDNANASAAAYSDLQGFIRDLGNDPQIITRSGTHDLN